MRKMLIITIAALVMALNACSNSGGNEIEFGVFTGTKNGVTYVLTVNPGKAAYAVGNAYTLTATGNGLDETCTGKVSGITYSESGAVFSLQPSVSGTPAFSVNTIDIRIIFIDGTITYNSGATMQGPLSFVSEAAVGGGGGGGGKTSTSETLPEAAIHSVTVLFDDTMGTALAIPDYGFPGEHITLFEDPKDDYKFAGYVIKQGNVTLYPD